MNYELLRAHGNLGTSAPQMRQAGVTFILGALGGEADLSAEPCSKLGTVVQGFPGFETATSLPSTVMLGFKVRNVTVDWMR